jgi:hypothetical protein
VGKVEVLIGELISLCKREANKLSPLFNNILKYFKLKKTKKTLDCSQQQMLIAF